MAFACVDARSRLRAFATQRSKLVGRRLTQFYAATTLEDLRNPPGRFHQRAQYKRGRKIPWSEITRVRIVEIEDYHG